ncbi:DUF881 domain-containing protein [Luteococcus sp. Sow4_B9]|uniref:DUF881 domain-containing protein n=1 Tax=Luteococcus sp. Sow4_B9 TaxID=3438792 RepID=UPI003F97C019
MTSRAARRRARLEASTRAGESRSGERTVGEHGIDEPARTRPERLRAEYPAWDRILGDFFRPSSGQLMMALVLCLVGILTVMQVRAKGADDTYSSMRRSDLVQLLDQLNAEQARLSQQASTLEKTREQLATGADARRVAAAENQKRLDQLGIIAGTVAASGPGVRITIVDPQGKVGPELMLDAVEELRDAGAEAIEVNDSVRVVASTWFGRRGDSLVVDGTAVHPPYTLDVIGDEHALEEGARFRGGLVSQVQAEQVGGHVLISRLEQVQVTTLHQPRTPDFAKPA